MLSVVQMQSSVADKMTNSIRKRCKCSVISLDITIFSWLVPLAMGLLRVDFAEACQNVDRIAWHYSTKRQGQEIEVTLVRTDESPPTWVALRSDDQQQSFDEIQSTSEYVEIQNQETRLFIRLFADHAEWRQPNEEEWKRWINGKWTAAPNDTEGLPSSGSATARNGHQITTVYFVPKDREPIAEYEARIQSILAIVSSVYQAAFQVHGIKISGLPFKQVQNKPQVSLVRGEHAAEYYNNAPVYNAAIQWRKLAPEIKQKVGDPKRNLIIVFAETWDDGPAEHNWPGTIARGAYYGADGGLAILSAHMLADGFGASTVEKQVQLMFSKQPIRGRKAMGHPMNSPRGEFVEDGIGATAHELGHAFGLPHDMREEKLYLMGNGFRNVRLNFNRNGTQKLGFSRESMLLLNSSRFFSENVDFNDNTPPVVSLTKGKSTAKQTSITIEVSDDKELRGLVFFDLTEGTVIDGVELSGKQNSQTKMFPRQNRKGQPLVLQVLAIDSGGNQTRAKVNQ